MTSPARHVLVPLAAVVVMTLAAGAGYADLYGGLVWVPAVMGGVAAGAGVALLAAHQRWPAPVLLLALAVVYVVLGGPLAAPATTVAGVVPTLASVRAVAEGAVTSWKQVLTLDPPVGDDGSLLVVAFLSCLVAAAVATTLAVRTSRPLLAVLPVAGLLVLTIVLGTHVAVLPLLRSLVVVCVALAWSGWHRARASASTAAPGVDVARQGVARAAAGRAVGGAAVVLLGGCLVAAGAWAVTGPATAREILRDRVEPPFDPRDYASPLSGFRAYGKELKETTLLSVEGLPPGARIRLATMDSFDGVVWNVAGPDLATDGSGSFVRLGSQVEERSEGVLADVEVVVEDYHGPWLPTVGRLHGVQPLAGEDHSGSLFYNRATGTVVATDEVRPGDRYRLEVVVPDQVTDDQVRTAVAQQVTLPEPALVPDAVSELASTFVAEAEGDGDAVVRLRDGLAQGYFSDGTTQANPSRAGHGTDRIGAMLAADQLVGDDEQYASLMALAARRLGLPARVVVGLVPSADGGTSYTGDDVRAWVEVPFEGLGWVSFDPTPSEDRVPQQQQSTPQSQSRPQRQQPPPPVTEPELPPPPTSQDDAGEDDDEEEVGREVPWAVVVGVGLPVLLVLGLVIGTLLVKALRRRRRRSHPEPWRQLAGGWEEVLDRVADLRVVTPRRATRAEVATALEPRSTGVLALARRADTGTFAPHEPSPEDVSAYWDDVRTVVGDLRADASWWRRQRARLSWRSLRRSS